jgi:hypothetical protein
MPKGVRLGGRQKGTPNKINLATREEITRLADPVGFFTKLANGEAVEIRREVEGQPGQYETVEHYPTFDQRFKAQSELFRVTMPAAKSAPVRIDLPEVKTATDVLEAHSRVVAALASGRVTPDEAAIISGVLDNKRKAIETVEIVDRLEKIEQRIEKGSGGV